MLKKVAVLVVLLGGALAVLLLTAREAAFVMEDSVAVAPPPAAVWQALTEAERWPHWWPGVEKAAVEGGWREGAELELALKGNPETQPARVAVFIPGREMAWEREGVLGSRSRTRLRLLPAEGGTVVTLESGIVGPQAVFAKWTGEEDFARYHQAVLKSLQNYLSPGEADGKGER